MVTAGNVCAGSRERAMLNWAKGLEKGFLGRRCPLNWVLGHVEELRYSEQKRAPRSPRAGEEGEAAAMASGVWSAAEVGRFKALSTQVFIPHVSLFPSW